MIDISSGVYECKLQTFKVQFKQVRSELQTMLMKKHKMINIHMMRYFTQFSQG